MIYRAQRYERAYHRIRLGMPFGEAEVILESLPGRYDDKQLGNWVFLKDEGAFHIGKGPMTQHEIGPGRTDYANTTGEVWGRSRIWTDGSHLIHVYAKDGTICAKGYATAPPPYESWIAGLRFRLGL